MLGCTIAMSIIGAIIALTGHFAGRGFGAYSRIFTGLMMIGFGLFALNLVPADKLRGPDYSRFGAGVGVLGAIMFGLALGAASMTCSVTCCSPALPIALGISALMPKGAGSVLMMMVFALGYSAPLAAVVLGVAYGKWTLCQSRMLPWIRRVAGAVMIALGFASLV